MGDADEIVLILHGHEARRYGLEAEKRQNEQPAVNGQRHAADAHRFTYGIGIRVRRALERPDGGLQDTLNAAGSAMFRRVRPQQQAGQRRAERQGIERRQQGRNGDSQCELPVKFPL